MLLSTVSINDLRSQKGVHESCNPLIARVLREVGLVREIGEGVRRIYEVMRSNALAEPVFSSDTSGFTASLSNRSLYPDDVRLWLSNFDRYDLTEAQRGVLALGYGGREFSTQEIIDRLGIVDTDKVREVTAPLRSLGLIERTANHMSLFRQAAKSRVPKREVSSYRVALNKSDDEARSDEPTLPTTTHDDADAEELPADEQEVYLGNLPYSATKADIVAFLVESGFEVLSVNVPRVNVEGRENRGFAFVWISRTGQAPEDPIRQLDGRSFGSRKVIAQPPRGTTTANPAGEVRREGVARGRVPQPWRGARR